MYCDWGKRTDRRIFGFSVIFMYCFSDVILPYLTEKGRAAAEAMAEVFAEMEAQATRSFSPEETETLRTLLNRMCADAQAAEQGAQGV